ncbi:MAG: hypothetical protein IKK94_02720, partial [Clostridia bacterium]|nr:hypothetical protein [Clostridia bacterium]
MKKQIKIITFSLVIAMLAALFSFAAIATEGEAAAAPTSGYVVAKGGGETNIKWEVTDDGTGMVTLSFTIDAAAADKKQTTVLYGVGAANGQVVQYGKATTLGWGAHKDRITNISVGDGITEIHGGIANCFGALLYVEHPSSLTKIVETAYEGCNKLKAVTIRGNEVVEGEADISTVTELGTYVFDNC